MEDYKYCYRYPHPAVTTDCVVFGIDSDDVKILLIRRAGQPYKGFWALPGGFLNPNESADEGALRELMEETGFNPGAIEQFHTFSEPGRDPRERVISIAYLAITRIGEVKGGDDAKEACWFSIRNIPPLAFDHELVLKKAMYRVGELISLNNIGFKNSIESLSPENLSLLSEFIR